MHVLTPALAPLDERVLATLSTHAGRRASRVAELVHGEPAWRCNSCGTVEPAGRPLTDRQRAKWEQGRPRRCLRPVPGGGWCEHGRVIPILRTTVGERREVREVLRGLECVGKARQRGG